MSAYHLREGVPAVADYVALRAACGLGRRSAEAAARGLPNTLYGLVLEDDAGRLLGMGRLVGDGGAFVQVVDMAVRPEARGQGQGARILAALLDWAEAELPESCYLSLIASDRARSLYARSGFEPAQGMGRYI